MDINFISDPGLVPKPREEIVIEHVTHEVFDDLRRIRVRVVMTPFTPRDRPNLAFALRGPDGSVVSSFSVIETLHREMTFIMHVKTAEPKPGVYTLKGELFYDEEDPQHEISQDVTIPDSAS